MLLFDDGLDGVLAVDPDRRLAARSAVEGQRAGDEPYSMARVGDHLVVGWSRIYSVDIESREATSLGMATIFVPAAEPGRVWMVDYPGGAIGAGQPEVWQVRVDGERVTEPVVLDVDGAPVMGIPGGIAVETDDGGVVLWHADTGAVDALPEEAHFVLDVGDGVIVWCEPRCDSIHITDLDTLEDETHPVPDGFTAFVGHGPSIFRGPNHISPDGRHLAVLVDGVLGEGGTATWLLDRQTGEATVIEGPTPTTVQNLAWSPDGEQLFATSWSYGESQTTIWRSRLADGSFDGVILPFGGALSPLVIKAGDAAAYFGTAIQDKPDCPLPTPQGPRGICTFGF